MIFKVLFLNSEIIILFIYADMLLFRSKLVKHIITAPRIDSKRCIHIADFSTFIKSNLYPFFLYFD